MRSMGLSNPFDVYVCLSVLESKIIETAEIRFIRFEKGTVTMFELFFEGHVIYSADSAIYYLWELQIQSFLISHYSSPNPTIYIRH